ncbi:protein FAM167A [Biomphalaria glabrata]|nr:FAM167A-like protein [Biomphalaria glabrata]
MTRPDVTSSTPSSTMGSRADDPSMTPSQRKRPLSIIEEHDSGDDAPLPDTPGEGKATIRAKENISPLVVCEETPHSEQLSNKKHKIITNFATLDQGPVKVSAQKNNTSKQKKGEANIRSTSLSPAKSKTSQPIPANPSTDIKIPGWKKKKQRSPKKNVVSPSLSDPTSKSFQDKQNHTEPRTKSQRNKRKSQEEKDISNILTTTHTDTTSQTSPSKIITDGNGLARIRETAERLNLTSSSTSPPLVTLTSPKFSHRLRLAHASGGARPFSEGGAIVADNLPQITITSSSGTLRLPPDEQNAPMLDIQSRGGVSGMNSKMPCRVPFVSKYASSKFGSSYFTRRVRNDSVGSLSEGELSEGSVGVNDSFDDVSVGSDLKRVQETTEKLHLSPRRPSIMQWRQTYMESPDSPMLRTALNGDASDEGLTADRKERINSALDWLRNELQEMRSQDQTLARQLLSIRQDLHKLKLRRCTEQHQDLIDDFQSELEDLQEFSYVLDLPQPVYGNNPLKHIGVTRMNLSARRFSAC